MVFQNLLTSCAIAIDGLSAYLLLGSNEINPCYTIRCTGPLVYIVTPLFPFKDGRAPWAPDFRITWIPRSVANSTHMARKYEVWGSNLTYGTDASRRSSEKYSRSPSLGGSSPIRTHVGSADGRGAVVGTENAIQWFSIPCNIVTF